MSHQNKYHEIAIDKDNQQQLGKSGINSDEHYCHNVLVVEGDQKSILTLAQQLFPDAYHQLSLTPKSIPFDFGCMVPCADTLGVSEMSKWCIHHWGTRSNARNSLVTLGDNTLVIYFTTHWSPPVLIYQSITMQHELINITAWHTLIESVIT